MARQFFAALCSIALVGSVVQSRAAAQETPQPLSTRPRLFPAADDARAADLATIRAASQEFVAAFNRGDARAVAAHWTKEGEYIDETGRRLTGSDAIEQEYAQFFKQHPGVKLQLAIDSLNLLSADAAVEDGRARLEPTPADAPAVSKYTAIHVKANGKWLMATVRDTRIETPSAYRRVEDLEWLIGTWTAEEHGTKTQSECRWVANKSFVERSYVVTQPDGTATSGVQLIGWSPQSGQIQSWNFHSDGGHATGLWSPRANGWSAEIRGVTGDGTSTSAVNLLTKLDDNAYSWKSVQRSAGGQALPDTEEVVLRRSTASRASAVGGSAP